MRGPQRTEKAAQGVWQGMNVLLITATMQGKVYDATSMRDSPLRNRLSAAQTLSSLRRNTGR